MFDRWLTNFYACNHCFENNRQNPSEVWQFKASASQKPSINYPPVEYRVLTE
ncbi:hypothetical protein GWI33_011167, partial [Rhynchophorus ferrugineus]